MKRFFSKITASSVKEAKNRLKFIVNNDRINVSESKTLEKMRKDVVAVLLKYTAESAGPPQVSITCRRGTHVVIAATVDTN